MDKNDEFYGFIGEDSDDIFAADVSTLPMTGVGRRCRKCGKYFMLSGTNDWTSLCPTCRAARKHGSDMNFDEEGG